MHSRAVTAAVFAPALAFALLQLVPYGHDRSVPPESTPIAWDSPQTRGLAERACFDCHSNETQWPWYASVAPVSWLIQNHVQEGREALNFSAFEPGQEKVAEAAGEAGESVSKGEMPPKDYLLMHPEARLTAAEKQALMAGLDATFASFAEREGSGQGSGAEEESDD
jgi:heme-binding protein